MERKPQGTPLGHCLSCKKVGCSMDVFAEVQTELAEQGVSNRFGTVRVDYDR